LWMALFYY